jgi:hypothetical protein
MIHGFNIVLNPPASAFPAACRGVSEHKRDVLFFLRIEDSPQLAAESFNNEGCFILFFSLVAAFRNYPRVRVILKADSRFKVPLARCPQIKEKAGIVKGICFSNPLDIQDHFPYLPNDCSSSYACLYPKDEPGMRFAGK